MTFAALLGLKRYGRDDLICQMIKNEGRWLHMLEEGATTKERNQQIGGHKA